MSGRRPWIHIAAVVAGLALAVGCRASGGGSAVKDIGSGHAMHMPVGIHGMYLFGTDTLYLSHLPLFSSPHDWQVILEVTLAPEARAAYLADKQQGTAKIYTFNPVDQPFALGELVAAQSPRTTFKGSVFHDHFEDGHADAPLGFAIAQHAAVTIKRVVYAKQFDPNAPALPALTYLLFGHNLQAGRQPAEWWAAHVISLAPDFDQFVALEPVSGLAPAQLAAGIALSFPGRPNSVAGKLQVGEHAAAQEGDAAVNLSVLAEPYLETNDLAQ